MANPNIQHDASSHSTDSPPLSGQEKAADTQVEQVHTKERVPGHDNYYEKDGLRTYGDDMDHDHEPPVSNAVQSRFRLDLRFRR